MKVKFSILRLTLQLADGSFPILFNLAKSAVFASLVFACKTSRNNPTSFDSDVSSLSCSKTEFEAMAAKCGGT